MRIISFLGETGQAQWGRDLGDGSAEILAGSPYAGLEPSGDLSRVQRLLAPIRPPVVIGIGLNYRAHAEETGRELPRAPVVFYKHPGAVIGPGDPIRIPRVCAQKDQVDYEVELGVVIGKVTRDVPAERALDLVLGYTIGNDVSARRWQRKIGQWCYSKSFDTFCPLGPAIVTSDEIPDPQVLRLSSKVNGELRQDSNTADQIYPVAELIAFLSADTTLMPGTVILTGTPSGVGVAREPPLWLQPGDTVELEIEGIGKLINPVVAATP